MATPTSSFRLPPETLELLRSLAWPGESLAGVIVRAALALETAQAKAPNDELARRLEAIETRLEQLERGNTPVLQDRPPCHTPVTQDGGTQDTAAQPRKPRAVPVSQGGYPVDVQKMALAMADRGEPPAAIRAAIVEACGKSPSRKNLQTSLKAWRRAHGPNPATVQPSGVDHADDR